MTPAELLRQVESEGVRFRIVDDDVEYEGPKNVITKYWDDLVLNETAIYEILNDRALFEPLIQDPELYKVPHYTKEQKHEMIEKYIRRLEASGPRDDEPLIIEKGRIVRYPRQDHDNDDAERRKK